MSKSCLDLRQPQNGYPVGRKVIDASGRLGSLYDTSTDNLVDRHSVQRIERKLPEEPFICEIFSGNKSNKIFYFLKKVGFNDTLLQSIRLQMVIPSGIGPSVYYNQPINQNTRFLYYSYRSRKERLAVKAREASRIALPPLSPTAATHMITKILWGIEILCIIQIPKTQSVNAVDRLLHHISKQLKYNDIPVSLNNDDRRLISQLTNVSVFGSETCVDHQNTSMATVLNRLQDWQIHRNYHQPLKYTMQPLTWLYDNGQFQDLDQPYDSVNPDIGRIQTILERIDNQIKDLDVIFQSLPPNFVSPTLDQRLKDSQQQYWLLLETRDDFQERLRKVVVYIRQQRLKPMTIENMTKDQRYACLYQTEIETFRISVTRLLMKARLIEQFNKDQTEYINAFDIHFNEGTSTTNEDIDVILKRSFSNEINHVILWYSSDRLKREQADKWKQIYQELTAERQETAQATILIYVDFSQCRQQLESFVIVRLPSNVILSET